MFLIIGRQGEQPADESQCFLEDVDESDPSLSAVIANEWRVVVIVAKIGTRSG